MADQLAINYTSMVVNLTLRITVLQIQLMVREEIAPRSLDSTSNVLTTWP